MNLTILRLLVISKGSFRRLSHDFINLMIRNQLQSRISDEAALEKRLESEQALLEMFLRYLWGEME